MPTIIFRIAAIITFHVFSILLPSLTGKSGAIPLLATLYKDILDIDVVNVIGNGNGHYLVISIVRKNFQMFKYLILF